MPELVTIPIAIFELVIEYARPNMKLILDRFKVVDQLFEGYRAWNIRVDDVEVITEGKPSEQGIKFKIQSQRTSFFFGAAQCRLSWDDASWETVDTTVAILNVGLGALIDAGGIEIGTLKTSISLHIQPKTASFVDILRPFAPSAMAELTESPITAVAAVVKWKDRRVTIDGSAKLANAIFLKFERDFEGVVPFLEIAEQLRRDEMELFDMLGVQEDNL